MFAVIAEGGRQYRVQRGLELRVDYREGANPGDAVTFDQVLLAGNNAGTNIGRPLIEGAIVEAEVVDHAKGKKIDIAKFKRRKNMRRHTGHRQKYTDIRIKAINVPGMIDDTPEPPPAPEANAAEGSAS